MTVFCIFDKKLIFNGNEEAWTSQKCSYDCLREVVVH